MGDERRRAWRGMLAGASTAVLTLAAAAPALAQSENEVSELVVTAQRRAENVQEVPISISTFSDDRLSAAGVTSTEDLENITPGLIFGESGQDGQIFIRGVGATRLFGAGADPSSALYVDGVYRSRTGALIMGLLDVERIEVLRGPQGTLYGRNSTGGAIRVVSQDPGREFGGRVEAEYGNYDHIRLMGQVDIPLIEDKLLMRVSATHSKRDGYAENDGPAPHTFDRENLNSGRLTLKFTPSENFEVTAHAGFIEDDSDQGFLKHFVDPGGPFAAAKIIADPWKAKTNYGPREAPIDSWYLDATATWTIGKLNLTSITGYNSIDVGPYNGDVDVTEVDGFRDSRPARDGAPFIPGISDGGDSFTQELTLSNNDDGAVEWVAGLFYVHDDNYTYNQGLYIPLIPALAANFTTVNADATTKAWAAFANAAWRINDMFRLNLGIRYSDEKKEITRTSFLNAVRSRGPETMSKSWDSWTPRIGLDVFVTEDAMLYAVYSKGFKSGAFGAGSYDPPINPEKVDAFEVGAKTSWLEGRMTLNGSAFHYDYKDIQVQGLEPTGLRELITNAAKAKIEGAEVELAWRPIQPLGINAGLALLDATYKDFPTLARNLKGNEMPNSPDWTFNIGVDYTADLGEAGSLRFDANYFASDEKYLSEQNDDKRGRQGGYRLIDARVMYTPVNGRWDVSVYGKNLTDELVYSRTVISQALFGNGFLAYLEPPRTYGVQLRARF